MTNEPGSTFSTRMERMRAEITRDFLNEVTTGDTQAALDAVTAAISRRDDPAPSTTTLLEVAQAFLWAGRTLESVARSITAQTIVSEPTLPVAAVAAQVGTTPSAVARWVGRLESGNAEWERKPAVPERPWWGSADQDRVADGGDGDGQDGEGATGETPADDSRPEIAAPTVQNESYQFPH